METNRREKIQDNDVPMIEQYKVEGIMVHASKIVRNCVIGLIVGFMAIVLIVWIFTSKYNARTDKWLETYNLLLESKLTEVLHDTHEEIQQYAPP